MKCPFCGNDVLPGSRFCSKCGGQMPQTAQPPQAPITPPPIYMPVTPPQQQIPSAPQTPFARQQVPIAPRQIPVSQQQQYMPGTHIDGGAPGFSQKAKSMPVKKILTVAIPIVCAIVALVIILPMLSGTGGTGAGDSISFFADGDSVVVSGNNNAPFTIDGKIASSRISIDGSCAVLLTDYGSGGGTLWFVTTTTSTKIAEDVLAYLLSDTGGGVAYFTDYDSREGVAALYLYDTGAKNATRVTSEAMYQGSGDITGVCLSPNGRSVAYIGDFDDDNRELTGYIKLDGGTVEKFGDNMFVMAFSDGGRHIYYVKLANDGYSGSLHVKSGNNDNRLVADLSEYRSTVFLNRDYSQAIFNMDGRAYISQNGSERIKISNSEIDNFLVSRATQVGYLRSNAGQSLVFDINTFANTLAYTGDGLLYIDGKLEASTVPGAYLYNTYYATVSSDCKTLLFTNSSGDLISIDPTNPNAQSKELAEDVAEFVASDDGKTVYYVNRYDELWCVKGGAAPVKISDDVETGYLALANNGGRVFFLVDYGSKSGGELYYSDSGGKREKVVGGGDVTQLWSTNTSVFYVNVGRDLYRSGGGDFTLIMAGYQY